MVFNYCASCVWHRLVAASSVAWGWFVTIHDCRVCSAHQNFSTWRMEKRLIPDGVKRFFHRQVAEDFAPLAGVPHVRQIETPVSHVCKSRKAVFEKRRQCSGTWTGEPGAEEQAILMPLRVDIDDVVKSCILGWRLEVSWLKQGLDDFVGFSCDLLLDCLRHARSRPRTINPLSWYSCHIHILQSLRPFTVFFALSPAKRGGCTYYYIVLPQ